MGLKDRVVISSGYNGTSGSCIGIVFVSDVLTPSDTFSFFEMTENGTSCER